MGYKHGSKVHMKYMPYYKVLSRALRSPSDLNAAYQEDLVLSRK